MTNGAPDLGECVVCGATFKFKTRSQDGGTRRKYCSKQCLQKNWTSKNPEKRKAIVLTYDTKKKNKEAKKPRNKVNKLKNEYGWALSQLKIQLARQNWQCNGCLVHIDEKTACVDHDHKSGAVRGLLCKHCNWALGHAKDNPNTLRRLMSHLDHDLTKLSVYLIGALKNEHIPHIGNTLRSAGYDVMDEWFTPGEYADTNWQAYEKLRGRSYTEALNGRAAQNILMFDRSYLDHADIAIAIMPAGKSAMLELGYAKGRGKHTCLFLDGEDPDRYDVMPGLVDIVIKTEETLLEWLEAKKMEVI